jgi:predicted FMN-binding regulatory protein PaiB
LQRELDWLLDDAFHSFGAECQVGNKLADKVAASDSRQWRCLLADNPAELSAEVNNQMVVLRVTIDDLKQTWKCRVQVIKSGLD